MELNSDRQACSLECVELVAQQGARQVVFKCHVQIRQFCDIVDVVCIFHEHPIVQYLHDDGGQRLCIAALEQRIIHKFFERIGQLFFRQHVLCQVQGIIPINREFFLIIREGIV